MISFIFAVILSVALLVAFLIRLFCTNESKKDISMSLLVLTVLTLGLFCLSFLESSLRRRIDIRNLNHLIESIQYNIKCNRVFDSNDDKRRCLDSLISCQERVKTIAFDDTVMSIILGPNQNMRSRISMCENALSQQILRVSRLNDYIEGSIEYENRIEDNFTIHLIPPITDSLAILNIAFNSSMDPDLVRASYVEVIRNDEVVYSAGFHYRLGLNCFVTPHILGDNECVRLGIITEEHGNNILRFSQYGE